MKSNSFFPKAVTGMVFATLLAPSIALAQVNETNAMGSAVRAQVRTRVCAAINVRLDLLESRFIEVRGDIRERRGDKHERLDEARDEKNQRVEEREDEADMRRVGLYARLEAQADTDAKQIAVAEFISDVDAAVQARRAAFEQANVMFRAAVTGAVDARRNAEESAVSTFRTAVSEAVLKAQQACRAGGSGEEIRAQFQADVEAARDAFKQDKLAVTEVGKNVRAAAKVRNSAHAEAMEAFKAALESARVELKAAFSVEEPSEESEN